MISIIIPVFNQLKYTKQIISEIESKCVSPFEIIIIDDCSTDWTHEWLVERKVKKSWYAKKLYTNEKNMGTNYWRNKWVDLAEWTYIWIINNDILLTNGLDKELWQLCDKYRVACPLSTIGIHKRKLPLFKKKDNICWWCFMMRKEYWRPIPPQLVLRYGDDYIYRYNPNVWYAGRIHHFESITIKSSNCSEQQAKDWKEREKINNLPLIKTFKWLH